jgi:hypothetical protein
MDTAFQFRRDIVSGHVPSTLVGLNEGRSSGNAILRGAAVIEGANLKPGRHFAAATKSDTSPLFGGGPHPERMTIVGSKEIYLLGFAALGRLTHIGVGR